jgi:hypothetical protein
MEDEMRTNLLSTAAEFKAMSWDAFDKLPWRQQAIYLVVASYQLERPVPLPGQSQWVATPVNPEVVLGKLRAIGLERMCPGQFDAWKQRMIVQFDMPRRGLILMEQKPSSNEPAQRWYHWAMDALVIVGLFVVAYMAWHALPD